MGDSVKDVKCHNVTITTAFIETSVTQMGLLKTSRNLSDLVNIN